MTTAPFMARREVISTDRAPHPSANYVQAVRAGQFLFLAGQVASDFQTGVPAQARRNLEFPCYGSDIRLQTRYIMENIGAVLEAGDSSYEHVVKAQVFLQNARDFEGFEDVFREFFRIPPARTTVVVGSPGFNVAGLLVEVDLIALTKSSGVEREALTTDRVPRPIANYSLAIRAGDFIFPAGRVATDYRTGVAEAAHVDPAFPYYGSEIEKQTRYILENLRVILEDADSSLEDVVKAQVYLTDFADFDGFDQVWREYFPTPPPRTPFHVAQLLVPGCLVEIDVIAVRKGTPKQFMTSSRLPRPLANYNHFAKVGPYIFMAGQLASDFKTGVAPEARVDPNFRWYGSAMRRQTEYVLDNCKKILEDAGSSIEHVVKSQVAIVDLDEFHEFDKVWKQFFGSAIPPRTKIKSAGDSLIVPGTQVAVDLIAIEAGT